MEKENIAEAVTISASLLLSEALKNVRTYPGVIDGVIIITGGGGGLGSALADVVHAMGYPVALDLAPRVVRQSPPPVRGCLT